MKKFLLAALLSSVALANQMEHCDLSVKKLEISQAPKQILDLMHQPMMCAKFVKSGSVNEDFLANMIPHHEGAILSSKALLEYSKNKKVRKFAKEIIASQEKEVKEFKKLLKELKFKQTPQKEYDEFVKSEEENMKKMMQDMSSVKISSNIDKDYLEGMIPHHQGAIDSANNILKYSKNKKIRKIAKDIIKEQEKEIKEFKEFLSKN